MTEKNHAWLPLKRIELDPIERALVLVWSYASRPPRISYSQRYSLVVVEPNWRERALIAALTEAE